MSSLISEKERRILDALSSYQNGDFPSLKAAAKAHDVPPSTLYHRATGRSATRGGLQRPSDFLLLPLEEEALVDWCKQLARWGFPPRIDLLRRMAEIFLQQHSMPQTLGKQCVRQNDI